MSQTVAPTHVAVSSLPPSVHSLIVTARTGWQRTRDSFPSIHSVLESEEKKRSPSPIFPPRRLELVHTCTIWNRPVVKMKVSFAFSDQLQSWLEQEDASGRSAAASYVMLKRRIEGEEVEASAIWTPSLKSESTWFHGNAQYLGTLAWKLEDSINPIKPETFFDSKMDSVFQQSQVQRGGLTDFVYKVVARRFEDSCFSGKQHLLRLFS